MGGTRYKAVRPRIAPARRLQNRLNSLFRVSVSRDDSSIFDSQYQDSALGVRERRNMHTEVSGVSPRTTPVHRHTFQSRRAPSPTRLLVNISCQQQSNLA
jgi:hypothetical protein